MVNLYILDDWVPFPASEYGGLIVVIASSDEECLALLNEEGYYRDKYPATMNVVKKSQKFELANLTVEKGVMASFRT